MDFVKEYGPKNIIGRELMGMMLGPILGAGCSRTVFAHAQRKDLVIKVETGAKSFDNILERDLWTYVQNTKIEKFFAPIVDISPCGIIMLQKRTKPVTIESMPKKIPKILTDLKIQNWGRYKGRILCHDYAFNHCMEMGITNKLVKGNWWE